MDSRFHPTYCSAELLEKLIETSGAKVSPELAELAESELFSLYAASQNEYNRDSFRALWYFLEAVADGSEAGEIPLF